MKHDHRIDPLQKLDPTHRRYIRASELKTFEFCERAWSLERTGHPSTLIAERAQGKGEHKAYTQGALRTKTALHTARVLFVLGLIGAAIGLALLVTQP